MKPLHQPERRVAVRWTSTQLTPCHYATVDKLAARWASVLNVSLNGIGLGLSCALDAGKELIIELPCKDPAKPKAVIAHVVHSQPHTSGTWAIGCTFDRPLTQEELDCLM